MRSVTMLLLIPLAVLSLAPRAAAEAPSIPIATAVHAFADVARGFEETALGDRQFSLPGTYWARAVGDAGNSARRLGTGLVSVALAMPAGSERAVLNALGQELAAVMWPQGTADADFWKARTLAIVRQVRRVAQDLDRLAPRSGAVPAGVVLTALARITDAARLYDAPGDAAHWRAASDVFAMTAHALGRGLARVGPHLPASVGDLTERAAGDLAALESTSPYNDPGSWMSLAAQEVRLIARIGKLLTDLGQGL
jgi:hypothetical protein